jgi:hypothetical protein
LYEENKNNYDILINASMDLITNKEQKIRRWLLWMKIKLI